MLFLSWPPWLLMCITVLCSAAVAKAAIGKQREETGQWGQWAEWSACSADCSTGVTVRSRRCQHPHMLPVASLLSSGDDSVHCSGADKQIMLCNKQACGEGRGGWRAEECAKYDASAHGGQRYTWEPFIHPSDPCKLSCRAKGHHFYSNLAARVVDGTPCAGTTTHPTAVCLQGRCQPVGCDDVVGSPWREDACGVCKGDNTTCRKISGIFTRQDLKRGMNQIALIPAGATRVRVRGLRYSNNWLALQNADSGDFVLNGGEKRSSAGQLQIAGTIFFYKIKRRCAGQCLVAKGPTSQPLNLMLNTRGRNRGVMYSFNVPNNVSNGYFRRIIKTAGPRAEVIRNITSAQRARPLGPNPLPKRPHYVGSSNSSDSKNSRSSISSNSNNMNNGRGNNSNDRVKPSRDNAERVTQVSKESDHSEGHDDESDHSEGHDDESDHSEGNDDESDHSEGNDDEKSDSSDNKDDAMEEDSAKEKAGSDQTSAPSAAEVEEDVTSVPGPASQPDMEAGQSSFSRDQGQTTIRPNTLPPGSKTTQMAELSAEAAGHEQRMNITQKEKPRFVEEHPRADKAVSLELQGAGSEGGAGHPGSDASRLMARSESDHSVEEDVSSSIDAQREAHEAEAKDSHAPDVSDSVSGQQPEVSAGHSGSFSLLQSDGPGRQRYSSYSARARSRHGNHRSWRRFQRPKYSQSFTFRHRHGKEDGDSGAPAVGRSGSFPFRAVHVNRAPGSKRKRLRYRQQPQSQRPQLGRPAGISAFGQNFSGSIYVRNRQHPSQRQALRAGQSLSEGGSALLTIGNSQRPQRGNVDFTEKGNVQQRWSSGQLDDYKRQLLRRRKLIEQQIAAQNAEYQRRLEERNERLKRQHIEQQQRLRHQNDSHVSRPQPQHPQGREGQDRQSPPQEKSSVQSSASRLSGEIQTSSEKSGVEAPVGQPDESASVHSQPTVPHSPISGDLPDADRQRPLIISNRRDSAHKERQPSAPSNPGRGASTVQPEHADRRWPLFISNQRQQPAAPSGLPTTVGPGADSQDGLLAGRVPGAPYGSSQTPEDRYKPSESLGPSQIPEDRYRPSQGPGPSPTPEGRYRPSQGPGPSPTPEDGYRPSEVVGLSQNPEPDVSNRGGQPTNSADISPNLASLGGGFVAPQYIPENTRVYNGRSDFFAPSSSNQLPSVGESPLVIGAQGNVIPNSAESEAVIGGGDGSLAIDKAEDMAVYEWRVSGLTDCTLTCGGGLQQTVVVCLDTRTQAFVTEDNCLHVPRPTSRALTCNTRPCPAEWQPGQWSACSVSCGTGEQTRLVSCLARISPTLNVTMADDNCRNAEKPESRRACQNVTCNSWRVGNWSQCSAECGQGMRTRDVYCTDQTGYDVSDDLCSGSAGSKPIQEEVCVVEPCHEEVWYYTDWPQQCPTLCGSGTMERDVTCLGDGGASLPDSSCNMTSRPARQQQCTADRPCGGQWFTGEWGKCNVTCGSGHQEREVICMKGMSQGFLSMEQEDNCAVDEKPAARQSCEMDPCVAAWYMTSWSQCSQSCGTGHRTRQIKCLDPQQRPSSQCLLAEKPVSRGACNTASCVTTSTPSPTPAGGQCRDSFSRCQLVKHARMCRYAFYRKKCCATCTLDT